MEALRPAPTLAAAAPGAARVCRAALKDGADVGVAVSSRPAAAAVVVVVPPVRRGADDVAEEGAQDGDRRRDDGRGELGGRPDEELARLVGVVCGVEAGNLDGAEYGGDSGAGGDSCQQQLVEVLGLGNPWW